MGANETLALTVRTIDSRKGRMCCVDGAVSVPYVGGGSRGKGPQPIASVQTVNPTQNSNNAVLILRIPLC